MKKLVMVVLAVVAAAPALAGHLDQSVFLDVPVLGEAGLLGVAVAIGFAGTWGIRKYRGE